MWHRNSIGPRRTAYIALVRSIMEYGSVIWDPYTKQEIKLESIQRRGARFTTKDYKSREEGSPRFLCRPTAFFLTCWSCGRNIV
jgi:hypothetical protein